MSIVNNRGLLLIIKQPSPLQIDRAAFSANIILLIGYTFTAWFQIYEFIGRARETIAISVYFLGFALIVVRELSSCQLIYAVFGQLGMEDIIAKVQRGIALFQYSLLQREY
jgi:hypothetical protein